MSAYVVMIRERTTDPEQMSIYAKQAPLAREGHAVTPHSEIWCFADSGGA